MGVDNASLLRQTAQEAVDGLRKERGSFADMVCTVLTRPSIKGTEPYRAAKDTLARDVAGQAIGSDPVPVNFNMSSVNWDMKLYSRSFTLSKAEIADLNQYMSALGAYTETLVDHIDIGKDNDLYTVLTNSFNSHAAGNGNWSSASSTPVLDMQEAKRTDVPDADMCILGLKSAQELARHPDLKERSSYYSGGGAIGMGALRNAVAEVLDINPAMVYIFGSFYDSANPGQSLSIAYSADELCWIGNKRGLVMVKQTSGTDVTVETDHQKIETAASECLDILAIEAQHGTNITGI